MRTLTPTVPPAHLRGSMAYADDAPENYSIQQGFDYLDSYVDAWAYGAIAARGVERRDGTTTEHPSRRRRQPRNTSPKPAPRTAAPTPRTWRSVRLDGVNSRVATFPGTGSSSRHHGLTGRLVVQESADFIPRNAGDGQRASDLSIVIHDTPNNGGSGAGPKMLCVDLPFDRAAEGSIAYVTEGTTADPDDDVSGDLDLRSARITRFPDGSTTARLQWTGLTPDFRYPSHVHAAPCTEVSNGGPHYVRDIDCIDAEGDASVVGDGGHGVLDGRLGGERPADGVVEPTTSPAAPALSLVLHTASARTWTTPAPARAEPPGLVDFEVAPTRLATAAADVLEALGPS